MKAPGGDTHSEAPCNMLAGARALRRAIKAASPLNLDTHRSVIVRTYSRSTRRTPLRVDRD